MSQYIVSARKYRPQRFGEVVGQEQVTVTLKNALKSNHLAQSFLFCGPRGVGKTTCARILAKAINCIDPSEDMEPCDNCQSCESFNNQTSFNIHELDAASNNSVDDIRSLTEQVRYAPQSGKYKVYIIDEVHMLSAQAFNAFLKTLEEPPSYAIFILATTEKHKIIPTILSRCQIFDFKRIVLKDIVNHLEFICQKEGIQADPAALHIIGQKADGALRDALSLFDKISSYSGNSITYQSVIENLNVLDYEYFFKITDHLLVEDHTSLMVAAADILSKGFEGDTLILGLAEHFRNLLFCKEPATIPLMELSEDLEARYKEQSSLASESFLLNALDLAITCESGYKAATNKRLHMEIALLKMCFLSGVLQLDPPVISEGAKKKQVASPEPSGAAPTPEPPVNESAESGIAQPAPPTQPQHQQPSPTPADPSPVEKLEKVVAKESAPPPDKREEETAPEKQAVPEVRKGVDSPKATPEPRKEAPKFDDPMQELKAALSAGTFKGTQAEKRESIPLTKDSLEKAWASFLIDQAADLPSNFLSNAKALMPELKGNHKVVLTTFSSVSRGFILEQGGRIKEYLRSYFHQPEISLKVDLVVDETEDDKPKQYLNPKEQFNEMAKENPSLFDFQKRFDLDIDYDH